MDISKFAWMCSFLISGLVDSSNTGTVPCENYEVLMCGDADHEWSICKTKTPGVSRIVSAQLDTRFANRYCRRYGTPENFGLTSSGRAMWTVGWCFGTFFLCLDIDPDFVRDSYAGVKDSNTSAQYETSTSGSTSITEDTEADIVPEDSTSGYNKNFFADSEALEADPYVADEKVVLSEAEKSGNVSSNTNDVAESNHGLNPHLKFWLIFGIASGGLIIVILIGVISYLSMQCCDSNSEEAPVCKAKQSSNEKYFRQQKTSTSALMTSESDYCSDVYDFIPANTLKKSAHDSTKCKISGKPNNKQTKNGREKVKHDNIDVKHAYDTDSSQKKDTCKHNDYFVLIPHNISSNSLNCDNNNVQVYAHVTENMYDHLIHSPAVSISDSSTYHHLNFRRDACNVETNITSDQSVTK